MTRFARRLGAEFAALLQATRSGALGRGRPWLALGCCAASIAAATAWRTTDGRRMMMNVGGVYAREPLRVELARIPGSIALPTTGLPLWAAVLQLALVIGVAEMLFRRLMVVAVATLGQFASTLSARVMISMHAATVIGLPLAQARVLDTGPSGITTAVGAWVLGCKGAYATLSVLIVVLAAAAIIEHNLDGAEHLVAALLGVAAATNPHTLAGRLSRHRLNSPPLQSS